MKFEELLARCETDTLQSILGTACIRLLRQLQGESLNESELIRITVKSLGEASLLTNREFRNHLVPLLREEEAGLLCSELKLSVLDGPWASLAKANIAKNSERELALFNFFEVPLPPVEIEEIPESVVQTTPSRKLFPHQRMVSRKVTEKLRTEPYRVLLHMPTGSGKTRTAMSIVSEFLRFSEPCLVIWVAYSEELCEQAVFEFTATWKCLGDRSVSVRRFFGTHELDVSDISDGLIVAGLPKLVRRAEDIAFIGRLAGKCKLLVVDEAHQAVADYYQIVLQALLVQSAQTSFLGLTATPGRTWNDVGADEKLAEFFGRQKLTLEIAGYTNPVDYLVEKRYLARATFVPLHHGSDTSISEAELQEISRSLDIPERILQRLGVAETRNLAILAKLEQLAERHKRIIVFASSVDHAHLLAAVLTFRGLEAAAVTTRTSSYERSKSIDAFKATSPETRILTNYGVLTTGFDVPSISCAVIARPTKSLVLYSQMVGRAIRGPEAGGNEEAEIVTVVDSGLPGFGAVSAAFTNWEDVWNKPSHL